jgi:hypothetical protein
MLWGLQSLNNNNNDNDQTKDLIDKFTEYESTMKQFSFQTKNNKTSLPQCWALVTLQKILRIGLDTH